MRQGSASHGSIDRQGFAETWRHRRSAVKCCGQLVVLFFSLFVFRFAGKSPRPADGSTDRRSLRCVNGRYSRVDPPSSSTGLRVVNHAVYVAYRPSRSHSTVSSSSFNSDSFNCHLSERGTGNLQHLPVGSVCLHPNRLGVPRPVWKRSVCT